MGHVYMELNLRPATQTYASQWRLGEGPIKDLVGFAMQVPKALTYSRTTAQTRK